MWRVTRLSSSRRGPIALYQSRHGSSHATVSSQTIPYTNTTDVDIGAGSKSAQCPQTSSTQAQTNTLRQNFVFRRGEINLARVPCTRAECFAGNYVGLVRERAASMPPLRMRWVAAVWGLLMVLFLVMPIQAQEAPPATLDVVFALDLSGSFYTDITQTFGVGGVTQVDRALLLYSEAGNLPHRATDPDGLRFEAVRFISTWLADFLADEAIGLRADAVRVGVVGFNHRDPLVTLPLTPLSALTPEALAAIAPPRPDDPSHSDFYALYQRLAQPDLLGNSANGLLLLVTDSLPCSASRNRSENGVIIRDFDCRDPDLMTRHLQESIALLPDIAQQVTHISDAADWAAEGLLDLRVAWDGALQATGPNGRLVSVATIDELPQHLLPPLLEDVAFAATGQRDSTALGLFRSESNQFSVPPYLATLTALTINTAGDTAQFRATGATALDETRTAILDSNRFTQHQITLPPAGEWIYTGAAPLWLRFTPAVPALDLALQGADSIETVTQYEALQVRYQIRNDGQPLALADYAPQLSATLETPTSTQDLTLSATNTAYLSAPISFESIGRYSLQLNAQAGDDWPMIAGFAYDYLQPAALTFDVAPVQFSAALGTEAQQTTLRSTGAIEILRSGRVPLRITAESNGQAVAMPSGVTPAITLDGPACLPLPDEPFTRQAGALIVAGGLRFEVGECRVRLTLNAGDEVVFDELLGVVESGPTERLTVALLSPDETPYSVGQSIALSMPDQELGTPTLSAGFPFLQWPAGAVNLGLVFRNENNAPVDPVFLGGPETLPFAVTVSRRDAANWTLPNAVQLRKAEALGRYAFTLSAIPAGEYSVQIDLLSNGQFALADPFEYDAALLEGGAVPTLSYRVGLTVERNLTPDLVFAAILGLLLLLAVLVAWLSLRRYRRTAHPLSGALALYIFEEGEPREIWRSALPPPQAGTRNAYSYSRADVTTSETLTLPLLAIEATTKRRRDLAQLGGAWVRLKIGERWTPEREMRPASALNRYEFAPGFVLVLLRDVDSVPFKKESF